MVADSFSAEHVGLDNLISAASAASFKSGSYTRFGYSSHRGSCAVACQPRRPSPLVLLSWRRAAFGEWPDTVRELQGQQAVVLARRPKRSSCAIQVHLSRTPVWPAGMEVAPEVVVRSRTWRRRSGRIEVRDLLRSHRIANVEHPDAGVEHTARQKIGRAHV